MNSLLVVLSILIGYLIGSISFARVGLKLAKANKNISELEIPIEGENESAKVEIFGANAASMILGAKAGITIGIMDMLKAAVPMFLFRFVLYPEDHYYLLVWVAVLIGHNWPLYFGFKGGRGFSVIFGGLIIIDWLAAIILPIVGISFGLFVAGNMIVGYLSWLFFMPIYFWFRTFDLSFLYTALVVFLLFLFSINPEIKTMTKYRREGKLKEYNEGLYASSPRWRGMKKMQDYVNNMEKLKSLIGIVVVTLVIILFLNLNLLPK